MSESLEQIVLVLRERFGTGRHDLGFFLGKVLLGLRCSPGGGTE